MIVRAFIVVLFCFIIEEKGLVKTQQQREGVERSREELRAVGRVFALMIGGQRSFFIKIQR